MFGIFLILKIIEFVPYKLSLYTARLVIDRETRRPKGFGFVTFESEIDAQKALEAMNGRVIH